MRHTCPYANDLNVLKYTCIFSLSLSLFVSVSFSLPAPVYDTLHALSSELVIKRLLAPISSAVEVSPSIDTEEPSTSFSLHR